MKKFGSDVGRLVAAFLVVLLSCNISFAQEEEGVEPATRHIIIVRGVDGADEYSDKFTAWTQKWSSAALLSGFRVTIIDGSEKKTSCVKQLESSLQEAADTVDELWVLLIGHGTFDGNVAKFNLMGDDVSAEQLGEWLEPRKKLTVIVNCASCSAPFIETLTAKNRVVVTSTKSGYELGFSHFGEYMADAISSADIDLDKDEQTSLLEAVIVATGKTNEFYKADSRIVSEHALVEDNADARGTPVDWYRGVRVTKKAKDGTPADGILANQVFFSRRGVDALLSPDQIKQRNELENQVQELRDSRRNLTESQYYQQLQTLMVRLAELYESAPAKAKSEQPASGN